MKRRVEQPIRRPPSYPEYGSDLLGLEAIKLSPLSGIGLLVLMRWYAFANDSLPRDPAALAKVLGRDEAEVRANLTERVMSFFRVDDEHPDRLVCPELAAAMNRIMSAREKQARGADSTNKALREKRIQGNAKRNGTRDGKRDASPTLPELQRQEQNGNALNNGDNKELRHDEQFLKDYEAEQSKEAGNG
jgi:uncharacterized protein YdaU (DUF1376 family)